MNYFSLTPKKNRLDQYRPLPDGLVRNLEEWLKIELTYTSNAIEGNTLTRRETALVVEKGITVGGKTLKEHLEATNHAQAFEWVQAQVKRAPQDLKEDDILKLHRIILQGIDGFHAGCYRNVPVRLSGSAVILPNPYKVPSLMKDFMVWIRDSSDVHPVERASEAHYRLVTIHPFMDGNGRTARLLMNLMLMMEGYPPCIIRPRDRLSYIGALEKAQLGGPKEDYWTLIIKAVDRSFDLYLKAVQGKAETIQPDEAIHLKIGALSKMTGVPISTLRYWTKIGLLDVAEVTSSGYQLYSPDRVHQVKRIQELKDKRYTLTEIRSMIILS